MIQTFTTNHPIYLISQKTVNKQLRKVRKWLEANRLALNIDKTNFVIFHSPQNISNDQVIIKFGRKRVNQETYVKFLGVLLDSTLVWKPRKQNSQKNCQELLDCFINKTLCSSRNLKTVVLWNVFPFVSHGVQVWGLTYPTYLNKVFILQKKIIK